MTESFLLDHEYTIDVVFGWLAHRATSDQSSELAYRRQVSSAKNCELMNVPQNLTSVECSDVLDEIFMLMMMAKIVLVGANECHMSTQSCVFQQITSVR